MARRSSIDRLPREVREKIATLRESGRTIDEILTCLDGLNLQVSRSAMGRHVQNLDKLAEKIQRSRDVADTLVRRIGDAPENRQMQLNVELMHSVIMDLLMNVPDGEGENGEPVTFDAMQAMLISKSLDHLAKASKTDADKVLRIREEAVKKAKLEAAEIATKQAKSAGLTDEVAQLIRQKILGA